MYSMNKQIETVKEISIGRDITLEVRTKYYGGYYYLVKNAKSAYGQSFCGNYDQLISRGYSSLRQFYGTTEAEFLSIVGVN